MNQTTKSYFVKHKIALNQIGFADLFRVYESSGFIYPEKKAFLEPYLKMISENWDALIGKDHELLWVLTTGDQFNGSFASVAVWKQGNFGMFMDFEPGLIPIVTDLVTAESVQKLGAVYIREYIQSIWMREGFRGWFEHINSFLDKIEIRKMKASR